MESFNYDDNPVDTQHNEHLESQLSPPIPNIFTTHELQTQQPECLIPNPDRRGEATASAASASASVVTFKRKCKSSSPVWDRFNTIIMEVDNDSNIKHIAQYIVLLNYKMTLFMTQHT